MVDVLQAIRQRRSIRIYQARNVEPEKIQSLLEAVMAGPSACNSQPWEFIVVSGRKEMEALKRKSVPNSGRIEFFGSNTGRWTG